MYQVSEAFREAMKCPVQHFRLRGKLIINNTILDFTEDNIEKNTFSISNQCSGNENVEIGTVYSAELSLTFVRLDLPRYSLKDAQIIPNLELLTSDGYEAVPLGVFSVGTANWTTWGIEIVAYDNMSRFDKKATLNNTDGRVYDFLRLACSICKVELGMTEEEIRSLPNGKALLSLYPDNDIETWRDLISWCAQTTGTFATIDRAGRLVLRSYGMMPVDEIDDYHRFTGAKFSDFETRYTGMSFVNIERQTTTYYALPTDNGLTYNCGQNPLLQYGLESVLEEQRMAVLNAISVIDYVPMEVSMIGSPAYDLGDVIVFQNGAADSEKLSCITKYDWTYGGTYTVTGVGQNPALISARSKVDKDISGLLQQMTEDRSTFYIYSFLNAQEFEIQRETIVADIHFATVDNTRIDFIFTSSHEMTMDGEVIARVYLDGDLFQTFVDYEPRGKNVFTFQWTADIRADARYELKVSFEYGLFISDRRIDEANRKTLWNYADAIVWAMARTNGTWSSIQIFTWDHISAYDWDSLDGTELSQNTWDDVLNRSNVISPADIAYTTIQPDETMGFIRVAPGGLTGVVFGRGLAATDVWDGTISLSDAIGEIPLIPDFGILDSIRDVLEISRGNPLGHTSSDQFSLVDLRNAFIITGSVMDKGPNFYKTEEADNTIVVYCVSNPTNMIEVDGTIQTVEFTGDADARFAVTNDSGLSWFVWQNNQWTLVDENTNQTAEIMSRVPANSWNLMNVGGLGFRWTGGASYITIEREATT